MKHLALLAPGGLLLAPLAETTSFDHERAERADEKTICANRALNDGDAEMGAKYYLLRGLFAIGGCGVIQDRQQD